jgi:methylenetetrahydrofolate--tRNA-(uracil-5-)-methyltransferase
MELKIQVIGGGLAGCEAAWSAAEAGCQVELFEMRPHTRTEAHQTGLLSELVCSNSLKSEDPLSASFQLKWEMDRLGSVCLKAARASRVAAGMNLSVDRQRFAESVTAAVEAHPRITLRRERLDALPAEGTVIVATGPLTGSALARDLSRFLGEGQLYFYDAIAPIVEAASLDHGRIFEASRHGKGGADYLNCPLDKAGYEAFVDAVLAAEKHQPHDFEQARFFEGCMPIEDLAARGRETLRFGPMKPVGLVDPSTGRRPWACLQLRRENAVGTLYNLVGFQTRMAWGEQARVLRLIPGLEQAEFVRYGSLHRNTFLNAPNHLKPGYQSVRDPRLFFAGQMTGVEGYMESAASGILAGTNAARHLKGLRVVAPPRNTLLGALVHYQAASRPEDFQPINAAWGLVEPLSPDGTTEKKKEGKQERYARYGDRARKDFEGWLKEAEREN